MMADPNNPTVGVESNLSVTGNAPVSSPTPDSLYYFKIVVFQVGNTIFRVPRSGFEVPGTPFETMFSLPTGDNSQAEGSCDENPIVLQVDEKYFRGFLGALYPIRGRTLTGEDWLGALDLATMWMFDEIRKEAIQRLHYHIQSKPAKEAALLAKKYKVPSWLESAYTRLLQQSTLTTEELTTNPGLDWQTIGRLFAIKSTTNTPSSFCPQTIYCNRCGRNVNHLPYPTTDFTQHIRREFCQELREMATQ